MHICDFGMLRVKVARTWRETTPVCSGLTRLVRAGYSRYDSGASRERARITRRVQHGSVHNDAASLPCNSYPARSMLFHAIWAIFWCILTQNGITEKHSRRLKFRGGARLLRHHLDPPLHFCLHWMAQECSTYLLYWNPHRRILHLPPKTPDRPLPLIDAFSDSPGIRPSFVDPSRTWKIQSDIPVTSCLIDLAR